MLPLGDLGSGQCIKASALHSQHHAISTFSPRLLTFLALSLAPSESHGGVGSWQSWIARIKVSACRHTAQLRELYFLTFVKIGHDVSAMHAEAPEIVLSGTMIPMLIVS